MNLEKLSIGVGDRFAHQAPAQLAACEMALSEGVTVVPVWNKSNREHVTIGSEPVSVRVAADLAVLQARWNLPYHVDADHINLTTVDRFLYSSDFYTLDVADAIGQSVSPEEASAFADKHPELMGDLKVSGLSEPIQVTRERVLEIAAKYLFAVGEAAKIYRHILNAKGEGNFVTEVSMDETDLPQTPIDLLVILAAIADAGIPAQTIAPKFTGRFNKGVDYVGDVAQFEREFNDDLAVISFAVHAYQLPENLKLSIHSGSDKFSIYGPMARGIKKFDAGLHLKTAGTTWLEEIIGLAEAGGEGLALAKDVYIQALAKREALCAPYATVIDIDVSRLPSPQAVNAWTSEHYVSALRHDQSNPEFNLSFRQLIHVGYKVAAQMGDRYLNLLETFQPIVARNVTTNLFERHIKPLFLI